MKKSELFNTKHYTKCARTHLAHQPYHEQRTSTITNHHTIGTNTINHLQKFAQQMGHVENIEHQQHRTQSHTAATTIDHHQTEDLLKSTARSEDISVKTEPYQKVHLGYISSIRWKGIYISRNPNATRIGPWWGPKPPEGTPNAPKRSQDLKLRTKWPPRRPL